MTDSLGAVAIASVYQRQEAVALALEAGNDLLLFANQGTYVDDLARRVTDEMVQPSRAGASPRRGSTNRSRGSPA